MRKKLLFEIVVDDEQDELEVDAADIFVVLRRSFPKSLVSVEAIDQSMHQAGLTLPKPVNHCNPVACPVLHRA